MVHRGLRAACGAGCQLLHLQHNGWQVGGQEDRDEGGERPDLQAPGKENAAKIYGDSSDSLEPSLLSITCI